MDTLLTSIDRLSNFTGKACAWCLFAIGFFITYEVVMRYVFTAPTIWVDEICRILQVWVVFLGAPYVLKCRDMVTIDVILRTEGTFLRRIAETFATLILVIFAGTALYYGYEIWLKAALAGHTTDTYLAPPKAFTHAPVWVGSVLLIAQALADLYRSWRGDPPVATSSLGTH